MKIIFETFEAYNAAKLIPLDSIVIGDPIFETVDDLLTGRYIVDHSFTEEQLAELAANGIVPEDEPE